ncbi:TetR/AcrR family transcriptional regulator C-terminal domain-containing protein [Pseudoxanthomonas winnipegensis]|uniref:TetR/AcrR family transcriptional regulator C-terminal domain-containing protein n=1 Tax=Pseudoxanthomonas winnipegensis TaxID=2480810 RepID=UPI00103F086B|nr:TetR/AcrR family transcriptional regulator C-terminal domain-containing protein [Pseudoxanthomonas winnipegensis]TBV70139.1 TetR family transcriptional regulator [Pseudoxanthomonas winnipegensis]
MRSPLTQDHILQAAFRQLDEAGMEGISLRKLACNLGIRAPSLYWHFKSKQALIDALADALIAEVARDIPQGQDWRTTMHQIASEFRTAFKAHRDGARVFAGTFLATENMLRVGDATIAALMQAGAPVTFAASTALDSVYYVMGFVIEEQSLPTDPDALEGVQQAFFELARARFPHCWEAREVLAEPNFDARFRNGIDLLLDGVEQQIRRQSAASP